MTFERQDAAPPLRLERLTLGGSSRQAVDDAAARVFDPFAQREAKFGTYPSVVIHTPDLTDGSAEGFLADAALCRLRRKGDSRIG